MINSITVTNHLSESVVLDLRSPEQSGFFVRSVEGLGPVKADINTTESLSIPGSRFNSSRITSRNIVFDLGFLEKPTIEHSRQMSYRYFPLSRPISIVVNTDNRVVRTTGYVESNEPDIFSSRETTKISVICMDPYFYSTISSVVTFSGVQPLFEFPFSNESLTEKLIVFGDVATNPEITFFYSGEAPVGIRMYIQATGPVGDLDIFNIETREEMSLDSTILAALTGSSLDVGDEIVISTLKGYKSVKLLRGGEEINILNALGPESDWFTLSTGPNTFFYTASSGASNLNFRIEYDIVYEGV